MTDGDDSENGGGAMISLGGRSTFNTAVILTECTFLNNSAICAFRILCLRFWWVALIWHVRTLVSLCPWCYFAASNGGGLYLTIGPGVTTSGTTVSIEACKFIGNYAGELFMTSVLGSVCQGSTFVVGITDTCSCFLWTWMWLQVTARVVDYAWWLV